MGFKYMEELIAGCNQPRHYPPARGRGQRPNLIGQLQLVKHGEETCTIAMEEAWEQGQSWLGDPFSVSGVSQPHMWQIPHAKPGGEGICHYLHSPQETFWPTITQPQSSSMTFNYSPQQLQPPQPSHNLPSRRAALLPFPWTHSPA